MTILALIPTILEFDAFKRALTCFGIAGTSTQIGKLRGESYMCGQLVAMEGGLGKTQFAIHAYHGLSNIPQTSLVICLGSAGGLTKDLNIGDVVVATQTIEHDFQRGLIPGQLPKFAGDQKTINRIKNNFPFDSIPISVKFGTVASGDESIVTVERAKEVRDGTGAIAAAWEGSGGARTCAFLNVPYIEVRGISDMANESAPSVFVENIPTTMDKLALFLNEFIKNKSTYRSG